MHAKVVKAAETFLAAEKQQDTDRFSDDPKVRRKAAQRVGDAREALRNAVAAEHAGSTLPAKDKATLQRVRKEIALTKQVTGDWDYPKARLAIARLTLTRAQVDALERLLISAGVEE